MGKKLLSEKDITKQIRDILKYSGIFHYKHYNGGAFQPRKGISDIIGCYKGRFLAIEVKREGWKPPDRNAKSYSHYLDQLQFIRDVNLSGGLAFFAADIQTVIKKLELENYTLFH